MTKKPTRAPAKLHDVRDNDVRSPGAEIDETSAETEVMDTKTAGLDRGSEIAAALKSLGAKKTLTGGSLPLIKMKDQGDTVLARFLKRTVAKDPNSKSEYFFLSFDVIDEGALVQNKGDVDKSIRLRAQLCETTSLEDWGKDANAGEIVQITYQGSTPNKKPGFAAMQHYTVESINFGK